MELTAWKPPGSSEKYLFFRRGNYHFPFFKLFLWIHSNCKNVSTIWINKVSSKKNFNFLIKNMTYFLVLVPYLGLKMVMANLVMPILVLTTLVSAIISYGSNKVDEMKFFKLFLWLEMKFWKVILLAILNTFKLKKSKISRKNLVNILRLLTKIKFFKIFSFVRNEILKSDSSHDLKHF